MTYPFQESKTDGPSKQKNLAHPLMSSSSLSMPLQNSESVRTDLLKYEKLFREVVDPATKGTFSPPCEYEQVPMSEKEFHRLDQILEDPSLGSDRKFPSFSFNSRTSMGIIKWVASDVHEEVAHAFLKRFEVAAELLSPAIAQRISASGSPKVKGFEGKYPGSIKAPDAMFGYKQDNGELIRTCTVEVGFSETYQELVEDAKQWIEGAQIQTVILVKLEEIPSYRCPTHALKDKEIDALGFPNSSAVKSTMFRLEDPADVFSPLQFYGLTWVGRMSAFLEIWKPNIKSGLAERQGDRADFIGGVDEIPELGIKLSDLCPIDDTDGGNMKLPLTWDRLRQRLGEARYWLAVYRCQEMLEALAKRQANAHDPDYPP